MMDVTLFYSEKQQSYFYVRAGTQICCAACRAPITANLIYHTIWRKKADSVNTYHVNCFQKISSRGDVDEFKMCVVVDHIPEGALPIFERRPALAAKGDLNTFEVHKITKGSEAQIIDRTRVSKNPNQSIMPEFKQHQLLIQKREEELGDGIFTLNDMIRDTQIQQTAEHEQKKSMEKNPVLNVLGKKRKKQEIQTQVRQRVYSTQFPKDINVDSFLAELMSSEPVLPGLEERKGIGHTQPVKKV